MAANLDRARRLHLQLGRRGEDAVLRLCEARGNEVLACNWRCRAGELDLVVRDGAIIRFIEVKSRRLNCWNRRPGENLSEVQCRRNRRAARLYRHLYRLRGFECRFDLCEVEFRNRWWIDGIYYHADYQPGILPEGECSGF